MTIDIVGPKSIFPSTIFIGKINPQNAEEVKEDITTSLKDDNLDMHLSYGNLFENKIYRFLCEDIILLCKEYFLSMGYQNIEPYITSMWGVRIDQNKNLYKHRHSNSFVSGVWYPFSTNTGLNFYKDDGNNFIVPNRLHNNILNSSEQKFIPFENGCFLFPSNLLHDTDINNSDLPRYSISFNIFVKGHLGEHRTLNYLKI